MDGIEQIFDNNGSFQGEVVTGGAATVSEKMLYQARLTCYQTIADKQILEERLKAKDAQNAILEERLKVKDVEQTLENERLDKEKALRECEYLKESAVKDAAKEKALLQCEHLKEKVSYEMRMKELELANLRMQLELEKALNSGSAAGEKPSRKRAQTLESEEENTVHIPAGGGYPKLHWLVAYEGDVEVTFDKLMPELGLLSKIESARFGDRWFSLITVSKRLRSQAVMRAMYAIPITGRVWVEAFNGCKTSVGVDVPEGSAQTPAGVRILAYIEKKGEGLKFPMVVLK
jgi:hypothetical protein